MKLPDPPGTERAKQGLAYADEDPRLLQHGFSMPGTAIPIPQAPFGWSFSPQRRDVA
jgi:hypothetical protein